ncbi:MAG: 5'-3' exonuclease H3TH domain-containing protein [Patescibacteria group bacterium]
MEKCIFIDGSGLVYRGFYAIPPFFKSPTGVQTNAVFGFSSILLSLLTDYKPDHVAVMFDKKGPTFRHKEFAAYKATRTKAPQELYDQIPLVKEVVRAFKIPLLEADGYEADDILATVARRLNNRHDIEILIATGDFDLFQIASRNTSILYPTKGFKQAEIIGVDDIFKKYSLRPEQIPDYKGLAGDSSDNIPGVKGIGDKGATALIGKYGSLEGIYAHLGEITGAIHGKLETGKDSAFFCKKLATLRTDVPTDFDLEKCRVKDLDVNAVKKVFAEYGFKTLQKRIDELYGITNDSAPTANVQVSLF